MHNPNHMGDSVLYYLSARPVTFRGFNFRGPVLQSIFSTGGRNHDTCETKINKNEATEGKDLTEYAKVALFTSFQVFSFQFWSLSSKSWTLAKGPQICVLCFSDIPWALHYSRRY